MDWFQLKVGDYVKLIPPRTNDSPSYRSAFNDYGNRPLKVNDILFDEDHQWVMVKNPISSNPWYNLQISTECLMPCEAYIANIEELI